MFVQAQLETEELFLGSSIPVDSILANSANRVERDCLAESNLHKHAHYFVKRLFANLGEPYGPGCDEPVSNGRLFFSTEYLVALFYSIL